jgi:hypothetical protein
MYGAVMYLIFLQERYFPGDPAFIARAWHGMRSPARGALLSALAQRADFADAFDAELRAHAGVGYADSVLEFSRWRWFAARRDDGQHFSEGATWRGAFAHALAVTPPFHDNIAAPQVGGVTYLEVDTEGAGDDAQLHLGLHSSDTRRWHAEALRYDADGNHDDWSVVLDATGSGDARVPVLGAARIVLFVQHTPPASYDPDYFRIRAQAVNVELELEK